MLEFVEACFHFHVDQGRQILIFVILFLDEAQVDVDLSIIQHPLPLSMHVLEADGNAGAEVLHEFYPFLIHITEDLDFHFVEGVLLMAQKLHLRQQFLEVVLLALAVVVDEAEDWFVDAVGVGAEGFGGG